MQTRPRLSSEPDEIRTQHGLSWDAFESFLLRRGEALPRVAYLEGTLELMSPSSSHEIIRKTFAEVVEAYLDHLGVRYQGVGAWLLTHAATNAGLEPDDCYILHDVTKKRPDLALEVIWTSGSINKLEIYRRLQVPEVWFWTKKSIAVYVLTESGYELRAASVCVPDFDFALVAEMLQLEALSDVRKALRSRIPPR